VPTGEPDVVLVGTSCSPYTNCMTGAPGTRRRYAVIVVGSGISGLFVALEARVLGPVLVLTKGSIDDCNTRWAHHP